MNYFRLLLNRSSRRQKSRTDVIIVVLAYCNCYLHCGVYTFYVSVRVVGVAIDILNVTAAYRLICPHDMKVNQCEIYHIDYWL